MPTNPNGANQYVLDPRQKMCWDLYVNPKSETFGNAYQSAQKAGYEEGYAAQITLAPWFLEKLRRLNLLGKAEKVLEECLDIPKESEPALVKVRQDTAKFIASTVGKHEGYSTRTETDVTSGNKPISIVVSKEVAEKYNLDESDETTK